jgi:hypothetical protein
LRGPLVVATRPLLSRKIVRADRFSALRRDDGCFASGRRILEGIVEATPLRLRACSAALALVVVLCAGPASAELLVSLDYQTDPALIGCPGAADFRKAIVRQLKHDPFRENAPRRMLVRLYAAGSRMAGRVEWRDASDQWEGERTFSSRAESCAEMARAMALATAIQIDLLALPEQVAPEKPPIEAKPPVSKVVESKPPAPPPAPPIVSVTPAPTPAPKESRIAIDVGMGVIQDFGDAPIFALPRIAVTVGRPSAMGVRLAVSGLGPGADVTRTEGIAQIDRFVMTLELVHFFRTGQRIQPLVAAGAGWQDVRVKGISAMPQLAHEGQAVSGLLTASAGVAFALAPRLAVVVEVETMLFWPSLTVEIGSSPAAHLDGAAVFAHGGVLARF